MAALRWFASVWELLGCTLSPHLGVRTMQSNLYRNIQWGHIVGSGTYHVRNVGTGRMPVELRLQTSKLPLSERLWIGAGEEVIWNVRSRYLPKSVAVDPDKWILKAPYYDEARKKWYDNAEAELLVIEGAKD